MTYWNVPGSPRAREFSRMQASWGWPSGSNSAAAAFPSAPHDTPARRLTTPDPFYIYSKYLIANSLDSFQQEWLECRRPRRRQGTNPPAYSASSGTPAQISKNLRILEVRSEWIEDLCGDYFVALDSAVNCQRPKRY